MKKNKGLFGLLGSSVTILPTTLIAASCNQSTNQKASIETVKAQLKEIWPQLSDSEKKSAIKDIAKHLKSDVKLTEDQIHYMIGQLNKDVGSFGAIVWYIKSVESMIGKEVAYDSAKVAFDKLKLANDSQFDFSNKFDEKTTDIAKPADNKSIPVVFMDIDETVLQNDWTEASAMLTGGYTGEKKEEKDLEGNRFAIPGAVEFINYVHDNGGLVFYNSDMNQSTAVRDAVKKNLKAVGVKFVQDFQFWMRGSMPYLTENEDAITDEKTKDMTKSDAEQLAESMKFTNKFRDKAWITWTNSKVAYKLGKKVYKSDRMDGMDNNTDGWQLFNSKVPLKTMMKVGDNFNDFFDRLSKGKTNDERVQLYRDQNLGISKFFMAEGANAKHVEKVTKDKKTTYTLKEVANPWKQIYVLIPGNSEYGGWNEKLGYGNVYDFYQEILKIVNNKKYKTGPSAENPTIN
ncbi:HAD family acid phosphatase [Mycoplasmopsis primatum]|uniref:HAD family acid phosphatase n=1 Tax=Mycoplasmopsis primatum TaxID=55604 RepID=UPI000496D624|nr:HAD family acid phosphatase [Mycoplasmopsis primatum]